MNNEYRIQTYELSSSNIFWTSQISEVFENKIFFLKRKGVLLMVLIFIYLLKFKIYIFMLSLTGPVILF